MPRQQKKKTPTILSENHMITFHNVLFVQHHQVRLEQHNVLFSVEAILSFITNAAESTID